MTSSTPPAPTSSTPTSAMPHQGSSPRYAPDPGPDRRYPAASARAESRAESRAEFRGASAGASTSGRPLVPVPEPEAEAELVVWPAAPLDAAQRAFDLLTRPPAPLSFDCRTIPGLPQRILGLDELRRLLADRDPAAGTDARVAARRRQVSDAAWRELVTRARRDGPAWVVAAVGVALPGLRHRAGLLTRGWHGDVADLDSELLVGFLERLQTIDLGEVNLCNRLVNAGARAVQQARQFEDDHAAARDAVARSLPPARPWDHPDFVLARAVAAGAITARDATLIARTRLEDDTLVQVAAELDVPVPTVTSWRRRAEHKLREAVTAGDLHWTTLPAAS